MTTRLRAERWSDGVEYLNPDEIARDKFGDWNSPEAVLSAAHWADARREELIEGRAGIAFETVFSTDGKVEFVERAQRLGYFVRVFFIGTSDPRINAARITGRVIQGGHGVPIDKIVSRYERSMANLSSAISVADRVYVYDNSVDAIEARLCLRTREGKLRKIYGDLPRWIEEIVPTIERHEDFVDSR